MSNIIRDEFNYERYTFLTDRVMITIRDITEKRLIGKLQVRCTQEHGFRSVNGVVEEVQLAYGGNLNAYLDFDIELVRVEN